MTTLKQGRSDLSGCDHQKRQNRAATYPTVTHGREEEVIYPTVSMHLQGSAYHCDHFKMGTAAYPTVSTYKAKYIPL